MSTKTVTHNAIVYTAEIAHYSCKLKCTCAHNTKVKTKNPMLNVDVFDHVIDWFILAVLCVSVCSQKMPMITVRLSVVLL